MRRRTGHWPRWASGRLLAPALVLAACTAPGAPGSSADFDWGRAGMGTDGGPGPSPPGPPAPHQPTMPLRTPACPPAAPRGAPRPGPGEPLPARVAVITTAAADNPAPTTPVTLDVPVFVGDLYTRF